MREAYTRQLGNLGVLFPQTVIRFTTAYELNMRSLLLPMLDGNGIMRVRGRGGWRASPVQRRQ